MISHKLVSSSCPFCGYQVDRATNPREPAASPKPGSLSMCLQCTSFLRFDQNLRLIALPQQEFKELPDELRDFLFRVRAAAHRVKSDRS